MLKYSLSDIYKNSFINHWESPALQDYGSDKEYSYKHLTEEILTTHLVFDLFSLKEGDKIAILGKNSAHWTIIYLSTVLKGLTIVPILDEFNPKDVAHILHHSEAKLFFCDEWFFPKIKTDEIEGLQAVFSLETFGILAQKPSVDAAIIERINRTALFAEKYPDGLSKEQVAFATVAADQVIVINYTSGTTSLTKGVMLMEKNIVGNVTFGTETLGPALKRSLAILPTAHIYGLMFSVLAQLAAGGKVTLLGKIPSPAILLDACKTTRPTLLCMVPLIFEKIYKMRIKPKLDKPVMKVLCSIPVINSVIYKSIGRKLYKQLGGEGLYQVIIGGAAINKEVEGFLRKIKFPFTVGYGMTECAPLISYIDYKDFVPESVGKELGYPRAKVRIFKENMEDQVGEIQTIGKHVMKGYYKDEEATRNTFTEDGWLKTGDLGYMDKEGNIFIKGRSKTMLLGPSGENIYPEAIESKLMNMPFIAECVVLQNKQHKLIAFVYPDYPMIEQADIPFDKINRLMANNRRTLNDEVARFENIQRIEIVEHPFPKTPKNSIKRYGLEYLLEESEQRKEKAIKEIKLREKKEKAEIKAQQKAKSATAKKEKPVKPAKPAAEKVKPEPKAKKSKPKKQEASKPSEKTK